MKKISGFSLIELIVVIVVLSIVAASVSLFMPARTVYQSDGFADVFLQDLRFTQLLSMSQNQRYKLIVNAGSYQIQNQSSVVFNNPETGAATNVYPAGVTITPTGTYNFDSIGVPYNNGVALAAVLNFSVTAGTTTTTVSITPGTGFIQ